MKNDFSERIKKIEDELLALKTASEYTSVRNTITTFSGRVRTGLYRITYQTNGETIISNIFSDKTKQNYGGIYPRTPQGSTQIVEVDSSYAEIDHGSSHEVTYTMSFVVVSNVPVTSITRIS